MSTACFRACCRGKLLMSSLAQKQQSSQLSLIGENKWLCPPTAGTCQSRQPLAIRQLDVPHQRPGQPPSADHPGHWQSAQADLEVGSKSQTPGLLPHSKRLWKHDMDTHACKSMSCSLAVSQPQPVSRAELVCGHAHDAKITAFVQARERKPSITRYCGW